MKKVLLLAVLVFVLIIAYMSMKKPGLKDISSTVTAVEQDVKSFDEKIVEGKPEGDIANTSSESEADSKVAEVSSNAKNESPEAVVTSDVNPTENVVQAAVKEDVNPNVEADKENVVSGSESNVTEVPSQNK